MATKAFSSERGLNYAFNNFILEGLDRNSGSEKIDFSSIDSLTNSLAINRFHQEKG